VDKLAELELLERLDLAPEALAAARPALLCSWNRNGRRATDIVCGACQTPERLAVYAGDESRAVTDADADTHHEYRWSDHWNRRLRYRVRWLACSHCGADVIREEALDD
jgi:hypothetical protein